jgi:general secretion pathway protein C
MWIERLSNRRFFSLANTLLVAALLLTGMLFVRDTLMFLTWEGKTRPKELKKTTGRLERHTLDQYEQLLKNNVFGFPPGTLSPLSAVVDEVEQVALSNGSVDLELLGAVAWAGGFGYAVLSVNNAEQEIYKRGDTVPGAGSLKHVGIDRVVIESEGEDLEFRLPDIAKIESAPPSLKRSGRKSGLKKASFARKTADNTYIIDQKGVEASLANPKRMLTDARLLPNIVNGKQEGFVIREIRPNGLYETLGLLNGDILLRVNEFDISSAETGLQAFTALQGMDRIDLDIMRNGNRMNLTYIIR